MPSLSLSGHQSKRRLHPWVNWASQNVGEGIQGANWLTDRGSSQCQADERGRVKERVAVTRPEAEIEIMQQG